MSNFIREYAKSRSISALMHFTKRHNLASILQRGLVTRDVLEREENFGALNDQYRHDHTSAVCLTIGFPNYKMLWSLRCADAETQWVVIALSPRVLDELQCAFCATNAAAARVSSIPLEDRMGLRAFQEMYADQNGRSRAQLGITDDLPTDPQAEVLVLQNIPPHYFFGVSVQNATIKAEIERDHPGLDVRVHEHMFLPRSDYGHWKPAA